MRRADASPANPITGNTFLRNETDLLRPFLEIDLTDRRALVAAVSGGSDSTALLLLTKTWLETAFPTVKLIAVTVDHGLRPEFACEAQQVAELCERHGIAHRIVRWDGEKPVSGLSAAARAARYQLLSREADAAGADIILTGHTLDDQLETVSMRQARGEGRGLAGMAPAALFNGRIWIVRPLLTLQREALRGFLRGEGVAWVDDPTNADTKYERARLRASASQAIKADSAGLMARIVEAQRRRIALGAEAAAILAGQATCVAPGLIRLAPDFATALPAEAAVYALRALLGVTGGMAHLPDEGRSASLLERLRSLPTRATLSRSVVDMRRQGIFLRRELRGLPGPQPAVDGMLWDGRLRVRSTGIQDGLTIAPFGTENARRMVVDNAGAPQSLVRAALAAEPALWSGQDCLGLVGDAQVNIEATRVAGPWAQFLPSFDLALVRAVGRLIGCPDAPPPPLRGHNEA